MEEGARRGGWDARCEKPWIRRSVAEELIQAARNPRRRREAEAGAGERRKRNATKQRKADAERQRAKTGEELYKGRRKISALFFSDDLAGLRYDAGEDSLTFFFLRGCCLVGTVYDTTQREDPLTFFF